MSSSSIIKNICVKIALISIVFFGFQNSAMAQFGTDSDSFLKAVEDRDGTEATKFIDEGFINTKQRITGRSALHIVVDRRDALWLRFLLQKKAKPDVKDRDGLFPLMRAVELNFIEGVESLLKYNASVDTANRSGETALIRAVHLDRRELVQILLEAGADPNRTDNIQGLSAREYATRDPRKSAVLAIMENFENNKKEGAVVKPNGKGLDFSGLTGPEL